MYGRQQRAPRWKQCVASATENLLYASGAMYVRRHFDQVCYRTVEVDEVANQSDKVRLVTGSVLSHVVIWSTFPRSFYCID